MSFLASRRSRRAVLVALLALVLAYPIAANAFLAFGGVQKAFEQTDSVKVEFRRAWSFWPGLVHVTDIRVTVQDRNVQFVLTMPSVDVDLQLHELLQRKFHATRLRGSGLVFRFRHRIQPESADLPWVAALPPVPGFSDPPLREAGPPEPPLDDAHYNLWTVHIDDVDVKVREVWMQMFRFQGEGRALGAFRLQPARRLWVRPGELRFSKGTIATGPAEVASDARGKIECKVDDFDVRTVQGLEPFHFISARSKLALAVPNLAAIGFLAGPSVPIDLEDGSGMVDMNAAIDHGVFTPDTRLAYRTRHLGVETPAAKFQVDGDLTFSATGPTSDRALAVSLESPEARLRFDGARAAPIALRDVAASAASSSADVTVPWSFAGAKATLTAAFPELRSFGDLPGARSMPVEFRRGRGEARLALSISGDRRMEGSLDASGAEVEICHESGVCIRAPKLGASGRGSAERGAPPAGRFQFDLENVTADRGATLALADSVSSQGSYSSEGVAGTLDVKGLRVGKMGACPSTKVRAMTLAGRVHAGRGGSFETHWEGKLEAASLAWGSFRLAAPRSAFSGSWENGRLSAELRAGALDLSSSGGAPKGWEARVGAAEVRANLRRSRESLRGPLRVEARSISGEVGATSVAGDLVAALDLQSKDGSFMKSDVSGVVQARSVALGTQGYVSRDYWADVELRGVHVDARQNLDLAGVVAAKFRDARPVLYILAAQDEIPSWAPELLPRQQVSLDLRIERFCRWTDVQLLEVHGGVLRASGRIESEPGETRGALLFQLAGFSPLSLGVEFKAGYSHVSPFAGKGWLEERLVPLTRAATSKHDERCKPEAEPTTCD